MFVELRLKTRYDIDIYSLKNIDRFNLYKMVLENSGIKVAILEEEYDIKYLVNNMKIIYDDYESNNRYVKDIHTYKDLFKLIEDEYYKKKNEHVTDNIIYETFNKISQRINSAQNHINSITLMLDSVSIDLLQEFDIVKFWEEVYTLLNESPIENNGEMVISKKIDDIIDMYNSVMSRQIERIRMKNRQDQEREQKILIQRQHEENIKAIQRKRLEEELERKREAEEKVIIETQKRESEEKLRKELHNKRVQEERERLILKNREEEIKLHLIKRQEEFERKRQEEEKMLRSRIPKKRNVVILTTEETVDNFHFIE